MPVFNSNRNGKHAHVVHFPFGIAKKVDEKKVLRIEELGKERDTKRYMKNERVGKKEQRAHFEDSEN